MPPFEDGAMMVSMLETYSTLLDVGMRRGDRVMVYGDGPNGIQLAAFAKTLGAELVGAAGHRADILRAGSHLVKRRGKVVLYSGVDPQNSKVSLWDFANNVALHKHFYPVSQMLALPVEDFAKAVDMTMKREAFTIILTL